MDEDFKLSGDDTMRHLRAIAQAPGELQFRLELVAALDRIRVQHEVSTKGIVQTLNRLTKEVRHISPEKLASLVNAQLQEKLKPIQKDQGRLWKASMWLLEKALIIGGTYFAIWLGMKK